MYINAHYICAMCRNSKSVAKKVAIFIIKIYLKKVLTNNNLRVNIQSQTNKNFKT